MTPASRETSETLINLTPHVVRLIGDGGPVEIAPGGPPARLVLLPDADDGAVRVGDMVVPLKRTAASSQVEGLPEPVRGVLLIVARPVAEALPGRDDLVYPHDTVRDRDGVVVGCRALGRPARRSPA